MAIEIVDLPIKNGDCPYLFVCLLEGMFFFTGIESSDM